METSYLDQAKVSDFTSKMLNILNCSMLGIMVSIGHRINLFETLSDISPSTISEIVKISGLNSRYVREWLSAMVVGGFIEYDSETEKYYLPREHGLVITKQAGYRNLASYSQWIKTLSSVEDKIVDCFRNGGGVSYEHYHEFLKQLDIITNLKYDTLLTTKIIPIIPGLQQDLEKGIQVLDVGCGFGHSTNILASTYPNSTVKGFDISERAITYAKDESRKLNLNNVIFDVKNAENLNEEHKFQFISAFDFIHDTPFPNKVLQSIYNSLDNNGTFLMVDIKASSNLEDNLQHPVSPFLYTVSTLHCMTVSLANNGVGLGNMWGRQKALEMLKKAGFSKVEVKEIEEDVFNLYYVATK